MIEVMVMFGGRMENVLIGWRAGAKGERCSRWMLMAERLGLFTTKRPPPILSPPRSSHQLRTATASTASNQAPK